MTTPRGNSECMRDNYILAARDLAALALDLESIGHDKEMSRADVIIGRLRGALHAYRTTR